MSRIVAAVLAVLLLAGCGGGEESPGPGPAPQPSDPAAYLPADTPLLGAVDLVKARQELGLPPDADPLAPASQPDGLDRSTPLQQLALTSSVAIPSLSARAAAPDIRDPVLAALDGAAIQAAAANVGTTGPLVTVISTTQPFDDIAGALEKESWTRDGDSLTSQGSGRPSQVTDAGEGIVLYTGPDVDAAALAEGPGIPFDIAPIIGDSQASTRIAAKPDPADSCLKAIGGWQTADGSRGTIRLTVNGTPRPESVQRDEETSLTAQKATFVRDAVQFAFTSDGPAPIFDLLQSRSYERLYRCDEL